MRTSPREASRANGGGAEWARLRPTGVDAGVGGCAGLGCLMVAAVLVALSIVVASLGGSIVGGMVIVALGLATGAVGGWKLLAAVGPRPRLWTSRTRVTAGDTLKVRWETVGRFKKARSIQITWLGQEVAIERGYDGGTYHAVFATSIVTRVSGPLSGTASIELPALMMPSFVARNSRIEWVLKASVRARGWPKAEETYLIEVLPNRVER